MQTFAIINQKGGTGKTTVTINLAAQLAGQGKRILVVDVDPQGNSTSASGVNKEHMRGGVYEALSQGAAANYLLYSLNCRYYLLGANQRLAGAEIELPAAEDNWRILLRDSLRSVGDDFDFAFIDCPPSLGVLTVNALVAANQVLIPMQCEYFAMEGLSDLADTIRHLRTTHNPTLGIAGIIRSMLDSRNLLARDVSDELDLHFGDKVFRTAINRNVRVAEAPSYQLPVTQYAPSSSGAQGYRLLGDEFLSRFAL